MHLSGTVAKSDHWGLESLRGRGVDLCLNPRRGGITPCVVNLELFRPESLLNPISMGRTCPELGIDWRNCHHRTWSHVSSCRDWSFGNSSARFCRTAKSHADIAFIYLMQEVKKINRANNRTGNAPCLDRLHFGRLHHVLRDAKSGACQVKFSLQEGRPARTFEALFP